MKIHVCISSDPSSEHYGQAKNCIKLLYNSTLVYEANEIWCEGCIVVVVR
jgi:hypothetical protein